jgi:hypothetical protein
MINNSIFQRFFFRSGDSDLERHGDGRECGRIVRTYKDSPVIISLYIIYNGTHIRVSD